MRKPFLILVVLIFVLGIGSAAYGQGGDPAVLASDWLTTQQSDNGSFGDEIGATAMSVIAQASVGQENEAALAWLEENVSDELALDEASFTVIAVIAGGGERRDGEEVEGREIYTAGSLAEPVHLIDGSCGGLMQRACLPRE